VYNVSHESYEYSKRKYTQYSALKMTLINSVIEQDARFVRYSVEFDVHAPNMRPHVMLALRDNVYR